MDKGIDAERAVFANRAGQNTLDEFKTREDLVDPQFWWKVLKNVRSGIMPPPKKPQPAATSQR